MTTALFFEELEMGASWTSQGRTITETDVVQFAGMTGDFNPLHVDHEHARNTPFRQVIAHGLLGLSWVAGLGSHSPQARTEAFLGIENWEFLHPLFIGDTVHVVTHVLEKHPSGRRRGKVIWLRELVNQKDQVVQKGHFVTLVALKSPMHQQVDEAASSVDPPHVTVRT